MTGPGFTDFYDAQTAHNIAVGGAGALGLILTEINYIKVQIDTQAPTQVLSFTIQNSSPITEGLVFYQAWVDPTTYQGSTYDVARAQMNAVISYFSRLGYSIRRSQDGTNSRLMWTISY